MKLKLFVMASLLMLASQAIVSSAKAADTSPGTIVVAGPIDPFCIAIQIKTGRPCKP